ncbi:translation initiation factor IF-2-like isoform X2 [Drosophila biarmipes]|uniref:translation initiation factor IF-2-like isoform X2 n=1 Tax=Drosophila biarmipes TaxID=125945 RepID=UPI001CDAC305|nr:translation initiation factor IF-2-like isoform X2 [Drosophila biarmipes]XP_050744576.1 translation initiation factor IF-2-like isoform X1 [Drosophila biarmipes]XP_050744577.1 translation initiation factor IF-2-like isoform X1 [Drosophila biarmipes]XP_050744581.1 translation initiation factor IF-2-like isoform X2 [Drosophila biarmipes]
MANVSAEEKETTVEKFPSQEVGALENDVVATEENGAPAEAFDCKKLTSEDGAPAADDQKEVYADEDQKEKSAAEEAKEESVEVAPGAPNAAEEANGDSTDAPDAEALKRKMDESAAEEKGAPAEDVVCKKLTSENAAPATEDQKEVFADDDQKGEAKKESIEAAPAAVDVAEALKRKADESAAVAEAEASTPQKREKVDVDEDEVSTEDDLPKSSPPWVLEY